MFNKIGKLTYNELLKQFKKKSVQIILVIILISSILLPVGVKFIQQGSFSNIDDSRGEYLIHNAQIEYDSLKNDNSKEGKIKTAMAEAELIYNKFYVSSNIQVDDWREPEAQYVKYDLYNAAVLKLIIAGYEEKDLLDNLINVDMEVIKSYYNLSKLERESELKKLEERINKNKDAVEKSDYKYILNNLINKNQEIIKEREKEISNFKEELKKDTKNDSLEKSIKEYAKAINLLNKENELYKIRIDNNIGFDSKDWKNNTLLNIQKLEKELSEKMLTEEEFNRDKTEFNRKMEYSEYKEVYNKNEIQNEEQLSVSWYSFKNNIPQMEFQKDARSIVMQLYDVYVILAVIMIIIIGGGIVANEFLKGTIRLLIIRPVSRGKILASKFLALIILGLGLIIASTILLIIASGITYEFGDFSIPVLSMSKGSVVEISYIMVLLKNMLISISSLIFITSVVFAISTLAKNTAMAVAISMLLYIGALPITLLLSSFKFTWVSNTLIPYMNISIFNIVPTFKEVLTSYHGVDLNNILGVNQLIITSVIIITITFIIFIKRDVKN